LKLSAIDCTKHQVAGCDVVLDSKSYRITIVDVNEKITIRENLAGSGAPAITTFTIEAPKFFHGNAIDVQAELHKLQFSQEKYPMVYLLEPFSIDYDHEVTSSIKFTPSYQLFCLAEANIEDWYTDDHYSNVIDQMDNLADEIISHVQTPPTFKGFGELTSSTRIPIVLAGLNRTQEGGGENVFADYLSGVRMNVNIPIKNNCVNLNNC
jgi:hypothetical protein